MPAYCRRLLLLQVGWSPGFYNRGMTSTPVFSIRRAEWTADAPLLQSVRRAVFIVEQNVPEELEWDADDIVSTHALALNAAGQPIGTGRLLPDGHIGRMAVSAAWRRHGVGQAILQWLIACARARGDAAVHLHAQTHALDFYARAGFTAHGAVFMEAGIPHRAMTLSL